MRKLSREEYVLSARSQAVEICKAILAGTLNVLEGCHSLASLRSEADIGERDQDFDTFAAISSETEILPIGTVRKHWAPEALAKLEPDIDAAAAWASALAIPACRSVVQRFEGLQGR